jgi:Zn-dependent protease with chaperone function
MLGDLFRHRRFASRRAYQGRVPGIPTSKHRLNTVRATVPKPSRNGQTPTLRGWFPWAWIDLYAFVLLASILIYFNGLLWGLCELVRFTIVVPEESWLEQPLRLALYGVYLCFALPLMVRVGKHLWRGVLGLVTNQFDPLAVDADGRPLPPEQYPRLYELVRQVAERIHGPMPDRILLSHRAECFVTERRQFSLSTKRELILVLGMPHLDVLSVGELQAILAHELAHFRRGDTRVGVFNFRFLEALRVSLDDYPKKLRWIHPLFLLEWAYFYSFLWLSAPIRRYQELRADAASAEAFGGDVSAQTLLKEWLLAHQFDAEVAAYRPTENHNVSNETVYSLFKRHWRGLSSEGRSYLERRLVEEETTSFFDSHPTMALRLAMLRAFPSRTDTDTSLAWSLLPAGEELEAALHRVLLAAQ